MSGIPRCQAPGCEKLAFVQDMGSFLDPPGTERWWCEDHAMEVLTPPKREGMTQEHRDWLADQSAERSMREMASRLRAFAASHRVDGTNLQSECEVLADKIDRERAHIVAVWD